MASGDSVELLEAGASLQDRAGQHPLNGRVRLLIIDHDVFNKTSCVATSSVKRLKNTHEIKLLRVCTCQTECSPCVLPCTQFRGPAVDVRSCSVENGETTATSMYEGAPHPSKKVSNRAASSGTSRVLANANGQVNVDVGAGL